MDLIIINGKIVTVDSGFSIAQAVAVRDGKIADVGTSDKVKKLAGKNTKVLNLKGKTMLPGINDGHGHMAQWGLSRPPMMIDTSFPVVRSIADIVRVVGEKAGEVKPGDWIQGQGWDVGYLDECLADSTRLPSKEDLDPVAPHNPVALTEYSGHRLWVNSKALELAGITKDTPNPVGGEIGKEPDTGEPNGRLYEQAERLVEDIVPPWTEEQQKEGILAAMAELNSLGVTSYTDPSVERDLWAIYNDVYNEHFGEGRWTCRVNLLLSLKRPEVAGYSTAINLETIKEALKYVGCRHNFGNEWLRITGAKLLGDGIPPLKTAWMYEPYLDGTYGGLVVDGDTVEEQEKNLREIICILHKNRFQVGIHCPGERAIDVCYDQYMKCIEEDPWDARHYTIHSDFARSETIKKIGEFGKRTGYELGMNVQSSIKWTIADFMATVVGPERAAYMWPLRTMLDNGIHVTDSSDASVTYPNWLNGVEAAVLRESKATGTPVGSEQAITVEEAIINYTINGAWQDHMEDIKGSIEAGKLADFCILDKDILTIEPHEISKTRCLMTIVGGRVVYDAGVLHIS